MSARERERARGSASGLFTANDVARMCQVDLKTIHNWASKEKIAHHRTEGRHLRFRRLDVVEFLREYGYPVPASLAIDRPRVCVIDADTASLAATRRALSRKLDVLAFGDGFDALVRLSTLDVEVVVLDDLPFMSASDAVHRLRRIDATSHLRFVVYTTRTESRAESLRAGASAFVPKSEPAKLRDAILKIVSA